MRRNGSHSSRCTRRGATWHFLSAPNGRRALTKSRFAHSLAGMMRAPHHILARAALEKIEALFLTDSNVPLWDFQTLAARVIAALQEEEIRERLTDLAEREVAWRFLPAYKKLLPLLTLEHALDLFWDGRRITNRDFESAAWTDFDAGSRTKPLMLLVEQNPTDGNLLKEAVDLFLGERMGVLDATDSGTMGLIFAVTFLPDFMLTDGAYLCSGISGYDMLTYLREFDETKAIPYSIVTANHRTRAPAVVLVGARRWIEKPYLIKDVFSTIEGHLSESESRYSAM